MQASAVAVREDSRGHATQGAGVALLTELFPPAVGGSAVLFYEIYTRLTSLPVTVITDARSGNDTVPHPSFRLVEHAVSTRNWGVSHVPGVRHHLRTASALRSVARNGRTVVHCARALPEGLAAWLASRLGGCRYVCWAHGEDLITARSSREYELLTTRILRSATFAIANSRNTASLISSFGVSPTRIKVVYPGVDSQRFSPAIDGGHIRRGLGIADDEILLLSVGRLQRRKGHDHVIRTLARLRSELPPLRYVIVGDGEEREYLNALAEQCRVGDRVRFVGQVADSDLPRFYAASDIFLMPNRVEQGDIEGFGIVFLEAASSCRPVIGGNSGGVAEAVVNGRTGLLVSGTDEFELAAAITTLAANPQMRRSMGEAGRARAVQLFSWDRAAAAVAELHAEACQ